MTRDNNKFKDFMISTLTDPVLIYTTVIMMSMMYHYRSSMTVLYGILTYVIGWVLFRLFDFIKKHNFIGAAAYIIAGIADLSLAGSFIETGMKNYPIGWFLWFFTPQDAVEYNAYFTLALYSLFMFFMCSVIYYFTRVRYRILMNFLIFIIPFAMYGKEGDKMPVFFIIFTIVGYLIMMITFRPLAEDDWNEVIIKPYTWASVGVFALIFSVIATTVPKPEINADRTQLETLINADELTDRLVKMLSVFQDSSDGTQFRNTGNNSPVYMAEADEPMHLKTLSYTSYDYETDKWKTSDYDTESRFSGCRFPFEMLESGELADAVIYAAYADDKFAEKYSLEDFMDIKREERKKVKIYTISHTAQYAPVPPSLQEMKHSTFVGDMNVTFSGLINSGKSKFGYSESYTFEYLPETFFYSEKNREFARHLENCNYAELLEDAEKAIEEKYYSFTDTQEAEAALRYISILSHHREVFGDYSGTFLDYGNNERILSLAEEITREKESEYEKARALELYFYNNGYKYDLDYRKGDKENAESFIFDSKTGVGYEYATAMTLLARAAGIPARYCEGFNMATKYEGEYSNNSYDINYIVTYQDAHGFPELYLKGYGWMSFEPTITNDSVDEEEEKSAVGSLAVTGIYILVCALLGLLAVLVYPSVSHRFFLVKYRNRTPDETVKAVMHRICRIYSIEKSCTSNEAKNLVKNISGADITETVGIFDSMVYGGSDVSEDEKHKTVDEYISAYEALRETKKQNRKEKLSRKK